jgi:GTP cyclohydrolase FolE2
MSRTQKVVAEAAQNLRNAAIFDDNHIIWGAMAQLTGELQKARGTRGKVRVYSSWMTRHSPAFSVMGDMKKAQSIISQTLEKKLFGI